MPDLSATPFRPVAHPRNICAGPGDTPYIFSDLVLSI